MPRTDISNRDDVFDSRDVQARIDELESERQDWLSDGDDPAEWAERNEEDAEELATLKALKEDAGTSEWNYGVTFIRDSYFTEYAEQLADDIGAVDGNANWPNNHIDWEAAADELKQDYSSVEFDGVTYWYRE